MAVTKKNERTRFRIAILLLGTIAVSLAVILIMFPRFARENTERIVAPSETIEYLDTEPKETTATDTITALPTGERPVVKTREIYLVIDDVGYNLEELDSFLTLDVPVTFAVLPQLPHTKEAVSRIREKGQGMLLHQPMEPIGDADPGPGAILTGMSREQVFQILDINLRDLDRVAGINNHMGSKATSDAETMSYVMEFLMSRSMFFLDSVTTEFSIAESEANRFGIPFTKRSGAFLDNENDYDSIRENFDAGIVHADRDGRVVLIGHVQSNELLHVLLDVVDDLESSGYDFKYISEYPTLQPS